MKPTDRLFHTARWLRDQFNQNLEGGKGLQQMIHETNTLMWRAHQEILQVLYDTEGEIIDYGHAPGTYMIRCVHCKCQTLADKRATSCWFCAKLQQRRDAEAALLAAEKERE